MLGFLLDFIIFAVLFLIMQYNLYYHHAKEVSKNMPRGIEGERLVG